MRFVVVVSLGIVVATATACVYHLHIPKCAGTFVWRFFRSRFCPDEARVCKRGSLAPPPACDCCVNPITRDARVIRAIRAGAYTFVSAHSLAPLGDDDDDACALAAFFRSPVPRVFSHFGYFRHRRGLANATTLASALGHQWASNQQATLLLRERYAGKRSLDDENRAAEALGRLAFVGIVEEMPASLCIFAKSFLPALSDSLCDPTTKGARDPPRENVARRPHPKDPAMEALVRRHNRVDERLYDLAIREFHHRLDPDARRLLIANRTITPPKSRI